MFKQIIIIFIIFISLSFNIKAQEEYDSSYGITTQNVVTTDSSIIIYYRRKPNKIWREIYIPTKEGKLKLLKKEFAKVEPKKIIPEKITWENECLNK